MSDRSGRVAVVGSFNVDHVWECARLPQPGETLEGRYATGPGGKGFNQAIAARRAGADAIFLCALGDDPGAALARSLAAADGLALRVRASDAATGTAGIYVDESGRNCILIGPGANAALDPEFVEAQADALRAADVVLAQLESPQTAISAALRTARDAGRITILNPAPANARPGAALLALADVLTPNESELAALLASHAGEQVEASAVALMASERLHGLCRELLPAGSVVVTLGGAGCFVSHPDDRRRGDDRGWYRVAAERAEVRDTTGAGDAFSGALAAALALGLAPFAACVRFAGRYAALSTERAGAALSMPGLADLAARFADA